MGQVTRVEQKGRRRGHTIDLVNGLLKSARHILIRVFAKADMAVAHLDEAEIACSVC